MATKKKPDKRKSYDPNLDKDDKNMLGDRKEHLRRDGGDDQQLRNLEEPVDFEAKDLDIPGRIQPDKDKKALKDEENQHYSQGGPRKENLEENQ